MNEAQEKLKSIVKNTSIQLPKGKYEPPELPWEWEIDTRIPNAYRNSRTRMIVVWSVENRDGDDWLHVSFSYKDKMPTYGDMVKVKNLFVGDRNAYMVFPTSATHVNTHKYCLHLWCNLTNPQPLPEFSNTILGHREI